MSGEITTLQVTQEVKLLVHKKKEQYIKKHNRGAKINVNDFLRIVLEDLKV